MTIQEAIEARHSVRAYKDQPLSEEIVKVLEDEIVKLNNEGQLHIQLICNEPKAFQGRWPNTGSSVMPTTIWSWQGKEPMTLMNA